MSTTQALRAVKAFRVRELTRLTPLPGPLPKNPALFNPFLPSRNPATGRWDKPLYSRRRQKELIKAARLTNTLELLPPGPKWDLNPVYVPQKERKNRTKAGTQANAPATPATSAGTVNGVKTPSPRALNPEAQEATPEPPRSRPQAWALRSRPGRVRRIWQSDVTWEGKVPPRKHEGPIVKMYAGRKKMFKGHKWQREMPRKVVRRRILLRDMPERIAKYRAVSSAIL
jgi:large subunit ribosomal protein L25